MSFLSVESDDYEAAKGQHFNEYIIEKKIGNGGFSSVWKVKKYTNNTDTAYALKIHKTGKVFGNAVQNEIFLLNGINHPNIITPVDKFKYYTNELTSRKHYCLVYDLCDYDLYYLIKKNKFKPLDKKYIKLIAKDILTGIHVLHEKKIIHSDVKPDNILFKDGIAKIADFSTADLEYKYDIGIIGTRNYRAPEVILGLNLSTKIDIWSIGCVLFELITGDLLFDPEKYPALNISRTENFLALMIELCGPIPIYMANGQYAHNYLNVPKSILFMDFNNDYLSTTIHIKKINKWPMAHILQTKYKYEFDEDNKCMIDLLDKMLTIDPNKRISAEECLNHKWFICE